MEKKLILRGLLAGAVGGLLAWLFSLWLAEPIINRAIEYETARDAAQSRLSGFPLDETPPLISRTVQGGVGLGVGMILFGLAMGALIAVAYSLCLGRTGFIRPKPLALLVSGAGFLTVFLIPFAKYPSDPPGASTVDTIQDRGTLFLCVLGISVLGMVAATVVGQALAPKFGTRNATVIVGLAYVAGLVLLSLVLPPLGHGPGTVAATGFEGTTGTLSALRDDAGDIVFPGFPADVLAEFRIVSMGTHLVLWSTIALIFAPLAERTLGDQRTTGTPRSTPVSAVVR